MQSCYVLILIRSDTNNGGDFTEHPVLKSGKHWTNFRPMVDCVKPVKKDDVLKLIDEIGVSDQVHIF